MIIESSLRTCRGRGQAEPGGDVKPGTAQPCPWGGHGTSSAVSAELRAGAEATAASLQTSACLCPERGQVSLLPEATLPPQRTGASSEPRPVSCVRLFPGGDNCMARSVRGQSHLCTVPSACRGARVPRGPVSLRHLSQRWLLFAGLTHSTSICSWLPGALTCFQQRGSGERNTPPCGRRGRRTTPQQMCSCGWGSGERRPLRDPDARGTNLPPHTAGKEEQDGQSPETRAGLDVLRRVRRSGGCRDEQG